MHFGREEVEKALAAAMDRIWMGPWSAGTAVELAADQALRARMPKPEPKPLGFWGSLAARLGLT